LKLNIDLTSLALIIWSGMLIISGSVMVLSSQVRRLSDFLEKRAKSPALSRDDASQARSPGPGRARSAFRRSGMTTVRRVARDDASAARSRRWKQSTNRSSWTLVLFQ